MKRVFASQDPAAVTIIHGLEHDHLGGGCCLAALPLDRRGSGAVFRLGVDSRRAATVDNLDELGQVSKL